MTEGSEYRSCPKCLAKNLIAELPDRDYRCGDCGLELAHLDTTATGMVRGVIRWLRERDAIVNDRYRVVGVLGKGGFGATYLVDDLRLHGRRRALKEIPELLFDEHESRLLGRLNHPAIPDITDRFSDENVVCLVLEFGGSRTLRTEQERRGGRIPLFVLLPWIRQLCSAIGYLHMQDPPVVHRDLKPDNVLLDDNDRVMLIDFGIAKESQQDTTTRTLGRAASQGFSPPEQVMGTGTDERSDVYALGAIVYRLLTGKMPAAAYERVTGAMLEPMRSVLPEIPPALDAAILKALELNINLRQQSIDELAQVFESLADGGHSAATVIADGKTAVMPREPTASATPLSSVRIPSVPLSEATASSATNDRDGAQDARRGRGAAGLMGGLGLVLALSAGGWFLSQRLQNPPPEKEAAGESVKESDTIPSSGPLEASTTPLAPVAAIPKPPPVPALPDEMPPKTVDANGPKATTAIAPTPPLDGSHASQSASRPATRIPEGELPSIFSDEQAPSTAKVRSQPPPGSLMDLFDQQRSTVKTEETKPKEVEPEPTTTKEPVKPEPAKTASTTPPKPTTTRRRQDSSSSKPTTRRSTTTASSSSTRSSSRNSSSSSGSSGGSSSWGFKYKGAEKQY